ncbi:MAG: hypothetical protein IKQ94_05280 [Bacteroidales bacterium]|nr:hypothetical protein [Bacteroidales bacterium]
MTDEEFEQFWKECKEYDAKRQKEWDAYWNSLSEEEKKEFDEKYDAGFIERMTDNPLSNGDD